ncbi:Uncharacterised protein [Klebsiella michiganensis]|jgi:hypothetical protein|nr:Uncharacterised protein [Klebsiella michiganensis]SBL66441.1 Uncharacterised protein [Klebsiella michiganensis]VTN93552.1 Uncharacterised protein [Klebsiella pneumoniae]
MNMICFVIAAFLAFNGNDAWPWFLAVGVIMS